MYLFCLSRLKIALPEPEPRVHFALVCGAKSCPAIKTYTPAVSLSVIIMKRTGEREVEWSITSNFERVYF